MTAAPFPSEPASMEEPFPARRRPPTRLPVVETEEWARLTRLMNLLVLALAGLDAQARDCLLERERDVTPLLWLAGDLRAALDALERTALRRATFRPAPPAELADVERQFTEGPSI